MDHQLLISFLSGSAIACIAIAVAIHLRNHRYIILLPKPKPTPQPPPQPAPEIPPDSLHIVLHGILYGGPLDGTEIEVPASIELVRIHPVDDPQLQTIHPPVFYRREPRTCPKSHRWIYKHITP